MTGTIRYCSLNATKGWEQGRKDDMESIGNMLVYFLKGSLPWQGMKGEKKAKMICQLKEEISIDELTVNLPDAFGNFLKYCRRLEFEEAQAAAKEAALANGQTDWEPEVREWPEINTEPFQTQDEKYVVCLDAMG